jgi:hypothetical protein
MNGVDLLTLLTLLRKLLASSSEFQTAHHDATMLQQLFMHVAEIPAWRCLGTRFVSIDHSG